MHSRKIVIAGGSGFIGNELVKYFSKNNHITILTRNLPNESNNRNGFNSLQAEDVRQVTFEKWDGKTTGTWCRCLEGAELIINLAGKTVNCRYTNKNKQEILNSRVNAVKAIGKGIEQCNNPPLLWINASSATIYRHAMDKSQDEVTGELGTGFSVDVCKQWEKTFFEQPTATTRKVALRMAITLGQGGVLIPYFNLLKFGLGGRQGSGKQMFSWIHIEDTCRMIEWIATNTQLQGVFNCCAPNPISNAELMNVFRKATGKKLGMPAPSWLLKIGAKLIGTEAELVLKSRWVIPSRISESGFNFIHYSIEEALKHIIAKVPKRQYKFF